MINQAKAVHVRHQNIRHDQIRTPAPNHFQCFLTILRCHDIVLLEPQGMLKEFPNAGYVFHH